MTGASGAAVRFSSSGVLPSDKDCRPILGGLPGGAALIEYNAFGALTHSSVGDLSPRRRAFFCEVVKNLRRPDHWDMRRLADLENFFLHLR